MRLPCVPALAFSLLFAGASPAAAQSSAPTSSPAASSDAQIVNAEICNETGSNIYLAYAYQEDKSETVSGWRQIGNGTCIKLDGLAMNRKRIAFYADARSEYRNAGLHVTEMRAWAGAVPYCVKIQSDFKLHNAGRPSASSLCPSEYEVRGFIPVTPELLYTDKEDRERPVVNFKYTFKK